MGRPLREVLENEEVRMDLLNHPGSFRFKDAPTLIITMCSWPIHTYLKVEDMNSKIVLDGIPTNFPIGGPMASVLNTLATSFNFTFKQIVPPDVSWGVRSANGTWSGMIRQVYLKEADMGLGPFQLIQSRFQDVDMTIPFSFDTLSLMVARGIGALNPWGFLMPFSAEVWQAFFIALITISISHAVLDYMGHPEGNFFAHIGSAVFHYAQPPMGQAMHKKSWLSWHRPLIGCWVILSLLLNSSYDGTLRSLMSLRHIPHPIQTLRDLIEDSSKKIIVEHRTSFTDIMGRVPSGDIHEVDKVGKAGRYVDLKMRDFMTYNHLVTRGDHVQIFDMSTSMGYFDAYFSKTARCDFYIAREKFIPTMYAMTFQKHSPITPAVNYRVRKMFEAGLYTYWMKRGKANYTACANPPMKVPTQDPIGFGSIWGLAVIWAAGMIVAAMVFTIEVISNKCFPKDVEE